LGGYNKYIGGDNMISLIIGKKGTGKTKVLVEHVNDAVHVSSGNVVCVEKETKLTYDVNYRARLIATDVFGVTGYDAFYGFLSGVCAGDHDITDIFVDATYRIADDKERTGEELAAFLKKVDGLSKISDTKFTFTISSDLEELPEAMFEYCEKLN
jgi:energy-coupling factor transporter ATP-binding protein EcfA2